MIDLIDVLPEPERPINKTFFVIGDAISTSPAFHSSGFSIRHPAAPATGVDGPTARYPQAMFL